jgi:hypothetical protein
MMSLGGVALRGLSDGHGVMGSRTVGVFSGTMAASKAFLENSMLIFALKMD